MKKIEDEYAKLYEENRELTKKYIALLEENSNAKKELENRYVSLLSGQEILDEYCDFTTLIETLKKQNIKIEKYKDILQRVLLFLKAIAGTVQCFDQDREILKNEIQEVLKSK